MWPLHGTSIALWSIWFQMCLLLLNKTQRKMTDRTILKLAWQCNLQKLETKLKSDKRKLYISIAMLSFGENGVTINTHGEGDGARERERECKWWRTPRVKQRERKIPRSQKNSGKADARIYFPVSYVSHNFAQHPLIIHGHHPEVVDGQSFGTCLPYTA